MKEKTFICQIQETDLTEVVKLHNQIFDDYFLKNLGSKLIYRYYQAYFQDSETIFLQIRNSSEMLGFILVTPHYQKIIKGFYKKNFLGLSRKIVFEILTFNKIIFYGLKSRVLNIFSSANKAEVEEEENCLLSIAVKAEFRGQNISNLLVDTVEQKLIEKKITAYSLSVKKENIRAKKFYEKIGFEKIGGKGELEYYTKRLDLGEEK